MFRFIDARTHGARRFKRQGQRRPVRFYRSRTTVPPICYCFLLLASKVGIDDLAMRTNFGRRSRRQHLAQI